MNRNYPLRGIRAVLISLIVLTGIAVSSASAQSREMTLTGNKEALALFNQGLMKADNLLNPGTLFDQAVQKDPNFAFGYLFAGQTNVEFQKNLEMAVKLADKASPGEREWILAANAQNNGDLAGSLTHWQNLEKLYPHDKRVHMQIGNYYRAIGDDAGGLKHYLAASREDKKYAPPYNIIGYTYVALGNWAEAEKAFKTYISLIPNDPNPYDSYGEMLLNSGKFDQSIKQYSMALAKDPTFYNSYQGMGNAYEYQGNYAKARESYQAMFDKGATEAQKAQGLASLMNSYVSEGNIGEALKVNARRIEFAQKAGDIQTVINLHNNAAFIATENGDFDTAGKELDAAAALMNDPSLPAANAGNRAFAHSFNLARMLIAKGDAAGAATQVSWMASAGKNVNQERAYNLAAGLAELKQGHNAKAGEFLAKANQADPYVLYYRAQALEASGDAAGARQLYQKVAGLTQLDNTGYAIVRPRAVAKLKK